MNLIKRLQFKFSAKRKQCKCCRKTFYKTYSGWQWIGNGPFQQHIKDGSICCKRDWIEV